MLKKNVTTFVPILFAVTLLATSTARAAAGDALPSPPVGGQLTPDQIREYRLRGIEMSENGGEWSETRQMFYEMHPELVDVDPQTEEGLAKIDQVIRKDFATKFAEKMRVAIDAQGVGMVQPHLHMDQASFAAIAPLVRRVQFLAFQHEAATGYIKDSQAKRRNRHRHGVGPDIESLVTVHGMLSEPSAQNLVKASEALSAIVSDPKSNDAEVSAAVDRLYKARADFDAVIEKAQSDLRAVLTSRQEAELIKLEILD